MVGLRLGVTPFALTINPEKQRHQTKSSDDSDDSSFSAVHPVVFAFQARSTCVDIFTLLGGEAIGPFVEPRLRFCQERPREKSSLLPTAPDPYLHKSCEPLSPEQEFAILVQPRPEFVPVTDQRLMGQLDGPHTGSRRGRGHQ